MFEKIDFISTIHSSNKQTNKQTEKIKYNDIYNLKH